MTWIRLGVKMNSPVADVEDGEQDGEQGEEEQILAGSFHFILK